MLDKLKQWFDDQFDESTPDDSKAHTLQVASALLLIEIARSDFEQSEQERQTIIDSLTKLYELTPAEAELIYAAAHDESEATLSLQEFTRLIHDECTTAEKQQLMQQLWRVALSDNQLDKYEEYSLRKIADLLYLSHSEFIQAKLARL